MLFLNCLQNKFVYNYLNCEGVFFFKLNHNHFETSYLNGLSAIFPKLILGLIPIEINSWNKSLQA